jgi:hypothetical protein
MTENLPAVPERDRHTDDWHAMLPAVVELSNAITNTEFVPDSLRGKVAATAAAIFAGREMGLPPMTALRNVHVIKGRPSLSAQAMLALVLARGHDIEWGEVSSARAEIRGRRRGSDAWTTVVFTIEDAKRAGYTKNDTYTKTPRAMLRARAIAELCRAIFPDVINGMPAAEELDDDIDDAPAAAPRSTGRTTVRRARSKTTQTDDGVGGTAPDSSPHSSSDASNPGPVVAPPPLPGEPGYDETGGGGRDVLEPPERDDTDPPPSSDDGDAADPGKEPVDTTGGDGSSPSGVSAASSSPDGPISKAQQAAMHGAFNNLGITERADRIAITSTVVGHDVASSNDLTSDEASALLSTLARCKTRDHVDALVDMIRAKDAQNAIDAERSETDQ